MTSKSNFLSNPLFKAVALAIVTALLFASCVSSNPPGAYAADSPTTETDADDTDSTEPETDDVEDSADSDKQSASNLKGKKRYVRKTGTKIYRKASVSSKVTATLKRDKKVKIMTEPNQKNWVKIKSGSKTGFVKLDKLAKFPRVVRFANKEFNNEVRPTAEKYGWTFESKDTHIFWYDKMEDAWMYTPTYLFSNEPYSFLIYTLSGDTTYGLSAHYEIWVNEEDDDGDEKLVAHHYGLSLGDVKNYLKKYKD